MESDATEIASTPPILEVEQALEVLCRVKRRFSQEPDIFCSFQDAMRAFHAPSVDPCVALARVASVLSGHPDLIAAFNSFLPPSYRLRDPGRTKPTMATTITRDVTVTPSPGDGGVRLKGKGRSSDTGEKAGVGVAADESSESGDTRLGATQSGDTALSIAASGSGAVVAAVPPDKAPGGAGSCSIGAGSPNEGSTGVCRDGGGGAAVGGERGGGLHMGSDGGGGSECVRVEESSRTSVEAGGSLCKGSDGSDRVKAEETSRTSVEGGGSLHRSSDGSGSVCVRAEGSSSTSVEGGGSLHRSSDGSGSVCVRAEETSCTSVEGGITLHRGSDGSGSVCVRVEETSRTSVEGGSTLHRSSDGSGSVCVRAEVGGSLHSSSDGSGSVCVRAEVGSTLHSSSDGSGSVCVRAEETSSASVEGGGSLHRGGDGGGSVCMRAEGSRSTAVVVEGGGAAVVRGEEGADGSSSRPSGFSAAAALVSAVKARFLLRPDVCRRFLHVLHTHQNQWDASREEGAPCCDARLGVRECDGDEVPGGAREAVPDGEGEGLGEVECAGGDGDESEGEWEGERCEALSRREVCAQLCELLKGEEDLLVELKKFLQVDQGSDSPAGDAGDSRGAVAKRRAPTPGPEPASGPVAAKRPRMPSLRDPSLAAAGMHGTLREISFFDRVRCALHSPEVYENFLRCVQLFNHNHVSPSALLDMARPFLGKFPELLVELRNLLEDVRSEGAGLGAVPGVVATETGARGCGRRVGPSYRSLPETYEQPRSSTRTALCREVLNDTWASFPSWSEDSTFVSSKKTHFEESIYRCEDERFELDVVLETNLATVRVLESVLKRLARLPAEEQARFRLDDALGGSSEVVHRKALQRAYGERGATDIVAALKLNPAATIPHVLKRLKAREDEWREAQRGFTRLWRDQGERFQVRSLDHRGITFRSADTKALRTKALVNEITALRDERVEQQGGVHVGAVRGGAALAGPHLCLQYADRSVLPDAAALILHQARHQAGLRGAELRRAAKILLFLLPDVLFTARADASLIPQDDSDEDEEEEAAGAAGGSGGGGSGGGAAEAEGAGSGEDGRCREERRCRMVERGERPIGLRERPSPTVSDGGAARDAGEQRGSGGEQRGGNLEQRGGNLEQRGNVPEQRGASSEQRRASGTSAEQEGDFATSSLEQARELSAVDGVYTLLFANTSWYVFLRLHQLLCARLLAIRSETSTATPGLSREQREVRRDDADRGGADRDGASAGDGGTVTAAAGVSAGEGTRRSSAAELCGPASTTAPDGPDGHYGAFLRHVRDLVDGQLEAPEYEERLREAYGVTAYVAYSMDRLLQNACRQLQHMVCDEACAGVLALYLDGCRGGASGGVLASQAVRAPLEASYQRQARRLLPDEHCYKVMFVKTDGCVLMTMELLDVEEDSPVDLQEIQKWSDYVQRYAGSVETSPVVASRAPIFLGRNLWAGGSRTRTPPGGSRVVFSEGLRCSFRPRSFRMLYVIHSEDVLYRRGALRAARQTLTACSERRRRAFRRFVRTWRERRASRAEAEGGRVA
ncbi:paired amphipathic helix protein Sin3b-like [Lethenteron reissneri]|uniref:paired amphipathic helix protein Sin3b-like n=1 Tax=Lethenteron reissneri TaxID=7753 RepID=UPI002AB70E93|nr:paired amphipathic helix protein Sin3b-like [Lethenteron reissneri]XP_061430978.1 paired amphipathic helix protein Sin3b-like [Lethenteron reissneri]